MTKTTEYTFENQTSETPAKSFLLGLTITADPNPESPTSPVFQSYQSVSPPLPPSTQPVVDVHSGHHLQLPDLTSRSCKDLQVRTLPLLLLRAVIQEKLCLCRQSPTTLSRSSPRHRKRRQSGKHLMSGRATPANPPTHPPQQSKRKIR